MDREMNCNVNQHTGKKMYLNPLNCSENIGLLRRHYQPVLYFRNMINKNRGGKCLEK